jgi:hypothetical protein
MPRRGSSRSRTPPDRGDGNDDTDAHASAVAAHDHREPLSELLARRGFAWRKVPGYLPAKLVGAETPDSVTTFSIFATGS